jgi:myo-inositol 2-dehydrogenase / D-chiro-inositol 1-dehydrogenase
MRRLETGTPEGYRIGTDDHGEGIGMSVGIGIIGAGVMGADHARLIAGHVAGAHLVAVSDADEGRAQATAKEHSARRHYADGDKLIADREVEAVIVASPDATHIDYTLACLIAGKPVLCEKPLAPTAAEALRAIEAEVKGGKRLIQVGYMRRFDPAYVEMRNTLKSGALGRAVMVHCAHRNVSAPDWFTPENSITNSGVHEIDIIRWLVDDEITAVRAIKPKGRGQEKPGDPVLMILETAGGVLADVEVFINARYGYEVRGELVCEEGTIDLARPWSGETRRALAQSSTFPPDWRGRFEDAYRIELQGWVNSLRGGPPVGASAWDGYAATAIAEAGVQSLRRGERVEVKLAPKLEFYIRT